ncbi:MAG: hypothetical protein ACOYT4_04615 [Nanoarchaeota archaeon]
MNRKLLALSLSCLLILCLINFSIAQDENNSLISPSSDTSTSTEMVSTETQAETEIMNENYGVQIRVLQLQKAIKRMILHGEAITSVIKQKGNDTAELDNIIAEMSVLLNESKSINTGASNDEIVQNFVDIKEDAISLRKEFKEKAEVYLDSSDKEALVKELKEIDRTELQEYNDQIKEKIRAFNSERVGKLMDLTGIQIEGLEDKIKNGEINSVQALKQIRNEYKVMSNEEKNQVKNNFKNNVTARDVKNAAVVSKIRQKRAETISTRAENRAQVLAKQGHPVLAARVQARADTFSTRAQNIENVRTAVKERVQSRMNSSASTISPSESSSTNSNANGVENV